MRKVFWFALLLALILFSVSKAQIPMEINYQGYLTDEETEPIPDGIYEMIFSIYDSETGGSALWSETQNVEVIQGLYNVNLGAITPLDLSFDAPYWMEFIVDGTVLNPRSKLTSSPYALNTPIPGEVPYAENAGTADAVDWSDVTGIPGYISDGDDYLSGESAGGDLEGLYPDPEVVGLQGFPITAAVPADGQVLKYDGAYWTPGEDLTGGGEVGSLTEVLTVGNSAGIYNIDMNGNAILNIDWGGSDDGASSMLDADYLDGFDGAYYLNWENFTGIPADISDGDNCMFGETAGGGLTGTYPNPRLAQHGATEGQVLKWNSGTSSWQPAEDVGGGAGDNWGTQVVQSDATLNGDGTMGNVLKIAQQGAIDGQVLKWDDGSSSWTPGMDEGGAGASPGGSAGQIQFNAADTLGGAAELYWDNLSRHLGLGSTPEEQSKFLINASSSDVGLVIDSAGLIGLGINSTRNTGILIANSAVCGIQIDSTGNSGILINRVAGNALEINKPVYSGIIIDSANTMGIGIIHPRGYGMIIHKPGDIGVYIDSSNNSGLAVVNALYDGINIFKTNNDGVVIDSAMNNGIAIKSALNNGIAIKNTGNGGIVIDSVADFGIQINYPPDYGIGIHKPSDVGLGIDSAAFMGIFLLQSYIGIGIHKTDDDGIVIDSAGSDGISIRAPQFNGVEVIKPNFSGVIVDSSFYAGLVVRNPGAAGVIVENAEISGVNIESAEMYGISIFSSGDDGIYIKDAGDDGVNIIKPVTNGIRIDTAGVSGLAIRDCGGTGIVVARAGDDGMFVHTPAGNGIYIYGSGDDGLYINEPDGDGVQVNNAVDVGVHVSDCGDNGMKISHPGYHGVDIFQASDDGVHVAEPGQHGFYVSDAGNDGIHVTSSAAWDGYFVGGIFAANASAGIKAFLIDHPSDPEHKLLRHYSLESPEVLVLYRGKVALDESGEATVELPDYFLDLADENSVTVHPTPVGRPFMTGYDWDPQSATAVLYGDPSREVAYIIYAERNDPVKEMLVQPVEENKLGSRYCPDGKLLIPEAYGYPEEMGRSYQRAE